jgi:uncharacterized Tic20 family protein
LKRYFALTCLLVATLLSFTSCAPVVRFAFDLATTTYATAPNISFLSILMIMAFAILLALIGILMIARQEPDTTLSTNQVKELSRSERWLLYAGPALLYLGIPLAQLFIPFWLWSKHRDSAEVINALNFQISWSLYLFVAMMLSLIIIGFPIIFLLVGFHIVITIKTSLSSRVGKTTRFPFLLDFIPGGK